MERQGPEEGRQSGLPQEEAWQDQVRRRGEVGTSWGQWMQQKTVNNTVSGGTRGLDPMKEVTGFSGAQSLTLWLLVVTVETRNVKGSIRTPKVNSFWQG